MFNAMFWKWFAETKSLDHTGGTNQSYPFYHESFGFGDDKISQSFVFWKKPIREATVSGVVCTVSMPVRCMQIQYFTLNKNSKYPIYDYPTFWLLFYLSPVIRRRNDCPVSLDFNSFANVDFPRQLDTFECKTKRENCGKPGYTQACLGRENLHDVCLCTRQAWFDGHRFPINEHLEIRGYDLRQEMFWI